ncbi:hypothetical protein Baya_16531 [Bagarius yarrelli]|uniref:Uncharacterized protein n=1 Tax=Bagarius yarrelli TaxID=175774 RepID=A0A556VVR6_BAGYA|nr:hypothetical protein Baya_16531 [Bagarius yarrelli]
MVCTPIGMNPLTHISFLPMWMMRGPAKYSQQPVEEGKYFHTTLVEEAVPIHLCPSSLKTLGTSGDLPSKLCRATAHFANKAYATNAEGAFALHAMAVLQMMALNDGMAPRSRVMPKRAFQQQLARFCAMSAAGAPHQRETNGPLHPAEPEVRTR